MQAFTERHKRVPGYQFSVVSKAALLYHWQLAPDN